MLFIASECNNLECLQIFRNDFPESCPSCGTPEPELIVNTHVNALSDPSPFQHDYLEDFLQPFLQGHPRKFCFTGPGNWSPSVKVTFKSPKPSQEEIEALAYERPKIRKFGAQVEVRSYIDSVMTHEYYDVPPL